MKTKFLILTAAMSFSAMTFAQKNEVKAADKALKSDNAAEAKSALAKAEPLLGSADEKTKALYYLVKGKTYSKLAKAGEEGAFKESIAAFNDLIAYEEEVGKKKYTVEAKQAMSGMTGDIVNAAIKDNNEKKFDAGADKLYLAYNLSKQDTVYLFYAANSAVNGQNMEKALKYYNELKDINYDGSEIKYSAVNIATGEREEMAKSQRDLMVKSKQYKDPKEEKMPSRKAEIVKNIALIYTQLGQDEKALEAYQDARANNPGDVNLILNEANLQYKLGNKDKFKELMAEATRVDPNNPDLFYNIGVINMEQENIAEARSAYEKAIELNPGYVNAQLNLSTTYVNEGNGLIDSMNALGSSRADIAKYDELKAKKDGMFKEGAQILEDALKQTPGNQALLSQLKNIYGALGDNENFMRLKKLLGE
ncbi:tetratricopeptide repeat protein [Cellulophaga fucicola]|uniref:tetratricopeptide repeat protein n=1 Tax=Cellulophaga fucicola TaxID=76595 RepID=UPI003EBA4AFF